MTANPTDLSGHASVWGPGNSTPNEATDIVQNTGSTAFSFMYTNSEIATLRSYAQAHGTYFQGAQNFDASRPLPSGLVFVDTLSGTPFTNDTSTSDQGSAAISGNFSWQGWLIVAGTINIAGGVNLTGLIYAQNDISLSGTAQLTGAIVSQNRRDSSSTIIDSTVTGTSNINYSCAAVRDGGGQIPQGWFVKAGTYMEISGQ